jgi:hypothetical protein
MTGKTWERWAGVAGLVFVAAIVASFFTPSTPDGGVADAQLAREIADDARGLGAGIYLLGLAALAFIVFAIGLGGRLTRAAGETTLASTGVVVGAALFTAVALVAGGVTLALIAAADDGSSLAAVRALFELDETLFIPAGWGLALFLLSAAVGSLTTRALPAWLGWSAAVLGAGFLVGLLGVMSADDEGGPLGIVYFIDLMLAARWVLAAAVALLREPRPARAPVVRTASPVA